MSREGFLGYEAYSFDTGAPAKPRNAHALSEKLAESVALDGACPAVRDLAPWPGVQVDRRRVLAGMQRCPWDRSSFQEALLVRAAIAGRITDDLPHGRKFDRLVVHNPFPSIRLP